MKDFELVLADEIADRDGLPPSSFQITRVVSSRREHFSVAHTYNMGLRVARGEVVVGMHDLSAPTSDFLMRHATYHTLENDVVVGGVAIYFQVPEEVDYDHPRFELFNEEGQFLYTYRVDHRYVNSTTLRFFMANNFSCKRRTIVERLDGFEEELDDSPYLAEAFDIDIFARLYVATQNMIFDRNITIGRIDHGAMQKQPIGGREAYCADEGARFSRKHGNEILARRRVRAVRGIEPVLSTT